MKIVFSSFDDMNNPFYAGGGAFSVHEVVKRLAKNHEVIVLTGAYPGSKDKYIDGALYKRISFFKSWPKLCQLLFQFCLPYYAMTMDYDVWFESFTPPFSTACLQLFTRRRIVGVTHLLGGVEMRRVYKLPFDLIERMGLKTYKEIIVMNEALKTQVLRANPNCKVDIIPNGENKDLINIVNDNREEEYILFLGRIDVNHKGLDYLLKIYKHISADIKENLVIAGSGLESDISRLKKYIHKHGLESKVKMIGKVTGEEKKEAFRKAKIFVMTSRIEAFPRVLLEAFCYEVPTIFFNIDVLNWVDDNVGIKIPPFDMDKFAVELVKLNSDSDKRKFLSKNGKEFVKNYDWDNIAQQYEEYIK